MPELVVTWMEVARYVDSLLESEKGRGLVVAKALKYLLFRSFVKSLKPGERSLMRTLERELQKKAKKEKPV